MKNKKYLPTKKNKGVVPSPSDNRVLFVAVGCGKCFECLRKKKRNWQVRLLEEIKTRNDGKFVTLTFSERSLDSLENEIEWSDNYYIRCNAIATLAVRRFLERWRKRFKKSVRHWIVTELGQTSTERIHLHGLLFTDESKDVIEERWAYGNVWVGDYVNERTINYIVKYVNKGDEKHKNYISKVLCSRGIGANYLERNGSSYNKFNDKETRDVYVNRQGFKMNLPIYYRNKLYSEDERESLWLNRLDEKVRYVDGDKIDISDGDEEYIMARNDARNKNIRLGYGNDSVNYDEKEYRKRLKKLNYRVNDNSNVNISKDYVDVKNNIDNFKAPIKFDFNKFLSHEE